MALFTILIVFSDTKLNPYKIHLFYEPLEDDFDWQNEFCEQMQQICDGNDNLEKRNTFSLNDHVNRQSCLYFKVLELS